MKYRRSIFLTDKQKSEIWDRWQRGESMSSIGRGFDRASSSIYPLLSRTGGIRPPARRRSQLALTLSEFDRGASYDLFFNAAEAENFINYRSMEKYLSALHEDDARQVSALAFQIDEESLAKEAVSDDRFLRINRRVARKFSRNLPGEQSFFTYVGRGIFVVMFDKVLVSNILKAVEFVEQRFHAEKAYPKLKFVKGRVTEINSLHDRAEDLLLQTLATLDLSDRLPMAVSENIPQRVASVWARLFGTKSPASQLGPPVRVQRMTGSGRWNLTRHERPVSGSCAARQQDSCSDTFDSATDRAASA